MTVVRSGTDLRRAAAGIVAAVADRLADPEQVTARATAARPVADPDEVGELVPWRPTGLGDGYPGLALLFAELAHGDDRHRPVAHEYLRRATGAGLPGRGGGLFLGVAGLGFAASTAARRAGEYGRLLAAVDEQARAEAAALLHVEAERIAAGRAGTGMEYYDTLAGLSGLGAYLLRRGQEEAVAGVLTGLAALTRPVSVDGAVLPGWWVTGPPSVGTADPDLLRGHANLGLAHGIAGPLALLALGWRAGVRVADHREAIERVVDFLLRWRRVDGGGPYWPRYLSRPELTGAPAAPQTDRLAWCYGTPGVARSLQLAAAALDRPDWAATAVDTMRAALARAELRTMMIDNTVCHGWSGLLHITQLMAADSADPVLSAATTELAGQLVDRYEPAAAFGFRHRVLGRELDRPGFLEGATGPALALQSFASGRVASGWDACLLLV